MGVFNDMLKNASLHQNNSWKQIAMNMLLAAVSLFINGFGIYLTIQANIGASPWDVLHIGMSKSLGILYGTASIIVSLSILAIDISLREPIGIAMFIDSIVVGKSVDFFNRINLVHKCTSPVLGVAMMLLGLTIAAYTQYTYMTASLGCGPRDTLLVALSKRIKKVPIGGLSIALLTTVTFIGWLLGGPVGIGTLISAFATGPIMQVAFKSVKFNAAEVHHQRIDESFKTVFTHSHAA